jgi:hypothetical protein
MLTSSWSKTNQPKLPLSLIVSLNRELGAVSLVRRNCISKPAERGSKRVRLTVVSSV